MNIYVLLADGFEEIEALTPTDVLRRAGYDVKTVSIYDRINVEGGHGITVNADMTLSELSLDGECCIILPGGGLGVENLKASQKVRETVKKQNDLGGYIAAICAAPTLLSDLGLLKDKAATCYPDMRSQLLCAEIPENASVVCDGNIITSAGAGTSGDFAFVLCSVLGKDEMSEKLRNAMCYDAMRPVVRKN